MTSVKPSKRAGKPTNIEKSMKLGYLENRRKIHQPDKRDKGVRWENDNRC